MEAWGGGGTSVLALTGLVSVLVEIFQFKGYNEVKMKTPQPQQLKLQDSPPPEEELLLDNRTTLQILRDVLQQREDDLWEETNR